MNRVYNLWRKILGFKLYLYLKLLPKHKLMDFCDYLAFDIDTWELKGKI